MIVLGDVSNGRENNLNLIRLLAAIAVLFSHAWPITQGLGTPEPLQQATGRTLGTYAVLIFFSLSGFLIASSYCRTPIPSRFAMRRARRILPGLMVVLFLTAFVMGPFLTSHTPTEYFSDRETWVFVLRNAFMIGLEPDLPGVFTNNPMPVVAGSIWTLGYEVLCYAGLLMIGMLGLLQRCKVVFGIAAAFIVANIVSDPAQLHPRIHHTLDLGLAFVFGVFCFTWRDRLALSPVLLIVLVGLAWSCLGTPFYEPVVVAALTYCVLMFGYWPSWQLPRLRSSADYSYGLYIYAFPIQGLVVHMLGPVSPAMNIAIALPVTIGFAAMSWHLIERPWLGLETSNRAIRPVAQGRAA